MRRLPVYMTIPPTAGVDGQVANSSISVATVTASVASFSIFAPDAVGKFAADNHVVVVSVTLPNAGVTTLDYAEINHYPAIVWVQANIGGALCAIVSATMPYKVEGPTFTFRGHLSAASATAGRVQFHSLRGVSQPSPIAWDAQTGATTTNLTSTILVPPTSLVVAASINDTATANQCTWTGTAGVTESDDSAVSTYRQSSANTFAPTPGDAQTVIATYDVISVAGMSLVTAVWR